MIEEEDLSYMTCEQVSRLYTFIIWGESEYIESGVEAKLTEIAKTDSQLFDAILDNIRILCFLAYEDKKSNKISIDKYERSAYCYLIYNNGKIRLFAHRDTNNQIKTWWLYEKDLRTSDGESIDKLAIKDKGYLNGMIDCLQKMPYKEFKDATFDSIIDKWRGEKCSTDYAF